MELALIARVGDARVPVLVAAVRDPVILEEVLRRAVAAAIIRAGTFGPVGIEDAQGRLM
jgi:hypothetical protein